MQRPIPQLRRKRNEPVLIITERRPLLTPGESYRATCVSHEWRWNDTRLVLIFELDDDEGHPGTIRKWLTVRDRLSPDTKLGQLYAQILNRPLELGDRLDPRKFHGCVFLVTVGGTAKSKGDVTPRTSYTKRERRISYVSTI